jgi:hypothetical protein
LALGVLMLLLLLLTGTQELTKSIVEGNLIMVG